MVHPGAVGLLALDEQERVLLVSQYRHPVGHRLLAAPAGLLDVPGDPHHEAAVREPYEEGHVRARDWRVLVDTFTSPGTTGRRWIVDGIDAVRAHWPGSEDGFSALTLIAGLRRPSR